MTLKRKKDWFSMTRPESRALLMKKKEKLFSREKLPNSEKKHKKTLSCCVNFANLPQKEALSPEVCPLTSFRASGSF